MMLSSKIDRFLRENHLMSLATYGAEGLACCSLFYAYDPHRLALIVASDPLTTHIRNIAHTPLIAGVVALHTHMVGKIQGIQFTGIIEPDDGSGSEYYFAAFAYARVMRPTLWAIHLESIKMTDNTLGFGKKLHWRRDHEATTDHV